MESIEKRSSNILGKLFMQVLLIFWAILAIYPIFWVFSSSLKTREEIVTNLFSLPNSLNFENFRFSENNFPILTYFKNSVIITLFTLVMIVFLSYIAGYAIAKLKIKGKNIIIFFLVTLLGIPIYSIMVPLYIYITDLGLLNSKIGLILPYIAHQSPFTILMLQAYFREFPDELIDAAKIDGCNEISAFIRIVFPISLGAISTVLILNFIATWNEFLLAYIVLKDSAAKTLTVGLLEFVGEYSTNWGGLFAGMTFAITPSILFYLIFHRNIMKGATAGAVKG